MQTSQADQTDQHRHSQDCQSDSEISRHYLAPGFPGAPPAPRDAFTVCTIAVASGAAIATSWLASVTATFESSMAIAGPATDRNPRTATAEDTAGEPAKRNVKSACRMSAK